GLTDQPSLPQRCPDPPGDAPLLVLRPGARQTGHDRERQAAGLTLPCDDPRRPPERSARRTTLARLRRTARGDSGVCSGIALRSHGYPGRALLENPPNSRSLDNDLILAVDNNKRKN